MSRQPQIPTDVVFLILVAIACFIFLFYLLGVFAIFPILLGVFLSVMRNNRTNYNDNTNYNQDNLTEEERRIMEEIKRDSKK